MNVYNQFIDPSTCLSSIACNFTGPEVQNLIVSKGTLLQVFEIIEVNNDDEDEDNENELNNQIEDETADNEFLLSTSSTTTFLKKHQKLSLISEYRMNGTIIDIHKLKSSENEKLDYLIVSTKFAKLSIISWDVSSHSIQTLSLHYYEPALDCLSLESLKESKVLHRTDPNGSCTVLHANGLFTVLPFYHPDNEDEIMSDDGEVVKKENGSKKVKGKQTESESEKEKEKEKEKESDNQTAHEDEASDDHATKIYNSSFIINSHSLKEEIKEVVDFTFLHSYREPTIAVLYYSQSSSWAGYLPKCKDNLKIVVLSLDLETHKATSIMELDNLPYDLENIYAVPSPINGFMLLGANEIIHVNSLGSAKGFSVNSFFSKTSDMILNRSKESLELMLESSVAQYLGSNDVLLINESGQFLSASFENIGGAYAITDLTLLDKSSYNGIHALNPLNITLIPELESCFVCCESGDSLLLGWRPAPHKSSNVPETNNDENTVKKADNEEDDDYWLYKDEDEAKPSKETSNSTKQNSNQLSSNGLLSTSLNSSEFYIMDRLINCGPLSHFTTAPISTVVKKLGLPNPNLNDTCIVGTSGVKETGALSIFTPTIEPVIKSSLKFSNVDRIWTLSDPQEKSHYLITTDKSTEKTQVFLIAKNYKDYFTKDFDNKNVTVAIGTVKLGSSSLKRIVQVTPYKVVLFDFKLRKLAHHEFENEIISAQIRGHLILLTLEHGEVIIFEYTESKENKSGKSVPDLIKLQIPKVLDESEGLIFTSGWISKSSILNHVRIGTKAVKRNFEGEIKINDEISENTTQRYVFFLTTGDNRILAFDYSHEEKVFELSNIDTLPKSIEFSLMDLNLDREPDPSFKQIMFTKLGDKFNTKDYLVILTFGGEIIMYENYYDPMERIYKLTKINEIAQLPVTGGPDNAYPYGTTLERKLVKLKNWQGYESIAVTGKTTYCILKPHQTMPKIFQFTALPTLSFAEFTTTTNSSNQVIFIDGTKAARICELDLNYDYSTRFPVRKIELNETPTTIAYHKASKTFVVSTITEMPYNPVDEEGELIKGADPELPDDRKGKTYKSSVKLISLINFSIIDTVEFDDYEVVTDLKSFKLDVHKADNNLVKSSRELISIGTSIYRIEDLATNGTYKIFEIINIVPEPGRPEANHRLKLFSSESFKGPAVSTCEVTGRYGVVQGQRLLIRKLMDDMNVTPVAFLDTGIYAKEIKTFENLILIGDSEQSVSLYGFDAEPYRTIKLSSDELKVKVAATDFLLFDSNLYVLIADEDGILHILQYDPSDANSLQGFKLVRKTILRHNGFTTHMNTIPRKDSLFSLSKTLHAGKPDAVMGFEVIASNIDGSFYRVVPVSESVYRRLYGVQQQIYDREPHWCGLNPRLNAIGNVDSIMPVVTRPVIELNVAKKYINMNEDRKRNIATRFGKNSYAEIYREFITLT